MADGVILLPIGEESDAEPADTAAAVRALLGQIDRTGAQIDGSAAELLRQIGEAIQQQAAEAAAAEEPERTEADTAKAEWEELQKILGDAGQLLPLPAELGALRFPLDKAIREVIFGRAPGRYRVNTAGKDDKKNGVSQVHTKISLEFAKRAAEREIEALSPTDKRFLLVVTGLYEKGIDTFSLSQLFDAMGGGSRANERQRQKLIDSMKRLCCTWVHADNAADGIDGAMELAIYPDRPRIRLDFALLEARRVEVTYNGKTVDAIKVLARPQWLQLAEIRGQITEIPFTAFSDGLSLTEQSCALSDYLLDRIARINRNPDAERRIRLDRAAEKAGAKLNNRAAVCKVRAKMQKKLEHYLRIGIISGFSEYENGFLIQPKRKAE